MTVPDRHSRFLRRTRRALRGSVAACLFVGLSSCSAPGVIFTRITEPLDLDFDETPIHPSEGQANIKHLQYNQVQVQWDSNAIGDIAKQAGFQKIYYADLETLSVLGLWNQYTVHVYGSN